MIKKVENKKETRGKRAGYKELVDLIMLKEKLRNHENRAASYVDFISDMIKKGYWSRKELDHLKTIKSYEFKSEGTANGGS